MINIHHQHKNYVSSRRDPKKTTTQDLLFDEVNYIFKSLITKTKTLSI